MTNWSSSSATTRRPLCCCSIAALTSSAKPYIALNPLNCTCVHIQEASWCPGLPRSNRKMLRAANHSPSMQVAGFCSSFGQPPSRSPLKSIRKASQQTYSSTDQRCTLFSTLACGSQSLSIWGRQGAKSIPNFHSMLLDAYWFSNSLLECTNRRISYPILVLPARVPDAFAKKGSHRKNSIS